MNSMKRQKDTTVKDELPRSVGTQFATGKTDKIAQEGMKTLTQSGNNTQLCMWLVMTVKSDAAKNNIALEAVMLSSWIKVNWKWSKLVELMEFQLSYFKSYEMMLLKCCTQYARKFGKLSSGHRTGKGQFSCLSKRKPIPKNVQTIVQLHSSHTLAK